MAQAITRLFDRYEDALAAVGQLEQSGVDHSHISLIANNADKRHGDYVHGDHVHREKVRDDDNDTAEGAAKGAATGGLLGGGAGLLAGLGMLAIPGLGPVVAAGWLVSTAVGAAAGALAGGATGGLLGALKDAGHSDEDAQVFAEGVRRGGTLVSVRPQGQDEAMRAEQVLNTHGGVDAAQRGAAYRQTGWDRFDEQAQPYSVDQIAAERARYQEGRSFQDDGLSRGDSRFVSDDTDDSNPIRSDRPVDPTLRSI